MSISCRFVVACLAAAALAPCVAQAQDVTIYRCVDAKGHTTLRDTPCTKDQKQETRTMTRPTDAPRKKTAPAPPTATAQETPVVEYAGPREIYVPPRPLYECITPDGVTYTSDTGEGNPRYVPLWTLGYNYNFGGGGMVGTNYIGPYAGASTFVRDTCYMLPQDEVCDRTRDRRDAIRTRFFNAMPSERDVLRVEERSLNARLANDCGGQ